MFLNALQFYGFCNLLIVVSGFRLRCSYRITTTKSFASADEDIDPNFEAHLPSLLKAGLQERPSPDVAKDMRMRYKHFEKTKRAAADAVRSTNAELAAELDELADELGETSEKFVQAAMYWDAWKRPSPDLPSDLRTQKKRLENREEALKNAGNDPNFEEHLESMMNAAKAEERPSPDLPSELRMMKFRQTAAVQRLAAKELRASSNNLELAAELDEIADEIEESHQKFLEMAASIHPNDDDYDP